MNFEQQAEVLRQAIAARDRQLSELTRGIAQLRGSIAQSTGPAQARPLLDDYVAELRETKEMKFAVDRLMPAMRGLEEGRA